MSARDDLAALASPSLCTVVLGADEDTVTVSVRAMDVVQLARFTRAVRPIFDDVAALFAGDVAAASVLTLIETKLDPVIEALAEASLPHRKGEAEDQRDVRVAERREVLRMTPIDGLGELLLAVLAANKSFFTGRLLTALRTAGGLASAGTGSTPSKA